MIGEGVPSGDLASRKALSEGRGLGPKAWFTQRAWGARAIWRISPVWGDHGESGSGIRAALPLRHSEQIAKSISLWDPIVHVNSTGGEQEVASPKSRPA